MRIEFTPWARRGLTPEDVNRIYSAQPRDGLAYGIADKNGRRITVRLFDNRRTLLAEGEGQTGAEAFDTALAKVAA